VSDPDLADGDAYVLERQVGFILRQVYQRHAGLFAVRFGEEITPMQWAAIAKLNEIGDCTQNLLGRLTAMDVATIKGVVERLAKRGLAETRPDPTDRRKFVVSLTDEGRAVYARNVKVAADITEETLSPLDREERQRLIDLLERLR
jgi:DNA-binding MarR family transcriptional regulator